MTKRKTKPKKKKPLIADRRPRRVRGKKSRVQQRRRPMQDKRHDDKHDDKKAPHPAKDVPRTGPDPMATPAHDPSVNPTPPEHAPKPGAPTPPHEKK
jgi:hypothetical protein